MFRVPMELQIEKIFSPSTGVDLVLDLNSLYPTALSSIIYDADFKKQTFVIAKPLQSVKSKIKFSEMHITTLINKDNGKQRVGLKCAPIGASSKYKLSNGKRISVVLLRYFPPIMETNIRSGYRLPLSKRFSAEAKLIDGKTEYHSSRDFTIRDISISGMGIIIPKKLKKQLNPLTKINVHHQAKMEIHLIKDGIAKPVSDILTDIEIKRINANFNEVSYLAGLEFINLPPAKEEELSRFIHIAQVDELKRLSGV